MTRCLPTVAVLHDVGSTTPMEILTAARRICRPLFVANRLDATAPSAASPCDLDVSGLSPARAADLLRAHDVAGITTFSERQLGPTAEIARAAGLGFLPVAVVRRCRDKLAQRRALAEAGVDVVRARLVSRIDQLEEALQATGLPAVIKPRSGMGSVEVVRVHDLRDALRWLTCRTRTETEYLVEEYLVGAPDVAGREWGDYVSVESVVDGDVVHPVAVTGKFPLSAPFRETGMIVPSTLGPDDHAAATALAAAAVRALGIDRGVTHTELKLTARGPRVIEVNARLGGYVADLVRRASGVDLVVDVLRSALGQPHEAAVPVAARVAYQFFLQPPRDAHRLVSIAATDDGLAAVPGVRRLERLAEPPCAVDWRRGTAGHVAVLHGEADDHDGVLRTVDAALAVLDPVYTCRARPQEVDR